MTSGSSSLFDRSLLGRSRGGLEAFVRRYTDRYWLYGSSKAALGDRLAAIAGTGENTCLEVPYYALESDLSPDLADLEHAGLECAHP